MTKVLKFTTAIFACALICAAAAAGFSRSGGQAPTTGPLATKAKVEVKDATGVIPLKHEEQVAFIFLAAIKQLEGECGRDAGGPCTIAQLVAGPKPTGSNTVGKLKYDPTTTDPKLHVQNYDQRIELGTVDHSQARGIGRVLCRAGNDGRHLLQSKGSSLRHGQEAPRHRNHGRHVLLGLANGSPIHKRRRMLTP